MNLQIINTQSIPWPVSALDVSVLSSKQTEYTMPDKHAKKRVSKACDCCRKSKTKCDGMRPCKRCLEDSKICTYMNKKKHDQMYPASYVDLLETRVSILVQSLNCLLVKVKNPEPKDLMDFCHDPELLNKDGDFDMNKVILKLVPNEKLDNLAESSEDYSIEEITQVTQDEEKPRSTSSNSTPSSTTSAGHHHCSLARASHSSENHIHKHQHSKRSLIPSINTLNSSFQAKFSIASPTEANFDCSSHHSLDITNCRTSPTSAPLESLLYNTKDEFSEVNSLTSPVPLQTDSNSVFSNDTIPSVSSTNIEDYLLKSQLQQPLPQQMNLNCETINSLPKQEPQPFSSFDSFDLNWNSALDDGLQMTFPRFDGIVE